MSRQASRPMTIPSRNFATPAPASSDPPFLKRSAPMAIPRWTGDGGEDQDSPPEFPRPHVGTPLIAARQPPRPTIPLMDRVIIDPGRHPPPPYTGKPLIRREDLHVSIRALPNYSNPNDPPPPDKFFPSHKVSKLDYNNFTEFLSRRDATLVTFYTPGDRRTDILADVISEAACTTKRSNHGYAGVNCCKDNKLCKDNNVTKLPAVRIYYRDNCLGEVKNIVLFTPEKARELVEKAPDFDCETLVRV